MSLKKFYIDFHHSQIPDPPADIIDQAMKQFEFKSREIAIIALKAWKVTAEYNKWDGRTPDYLPRYAMFMAGFVGGYNCHEQRTREITIGN